jgi:chromosome segregation ATPase
MEAFWRYAFEGSLSALILILGYFFSAKLASLSQRMTRLEDKCVEVEKEMARDNTVLETLNTSLRDHTTKEEVHWGRVNQMNERLIRIEAKMPNGRLDNLEKKVDKLLEKMA